MAGGGREQWPPMVTGEGDEVAVPGFLKSLQSPWHGSRLWVREGPTQAKTRLEWGTVENNYQNGKPEPVPITAKREWGSSPTHGLGSGVFEMALPYRGDAFRVVYAVQLAEEIWVIHAVRKKSTRGIKTPKREIDLIKERLKRLKEMLR